MCSVVNIGWTGRVRTDVLSSSELTVRTFDACNSYQTEKNDVVQVHAAHGNRSNSRTFCDAVGGLLPKFSPVVRKGMSSFILRCRCRNIK